jgi:hypothetical protein
MVMNTPRSGGASPWRIKVTVQAEPGSGAGSDIENESSPIVQRMTRTTTTTIPLKDDDASSPVKRRGRPRKSDATPGAKAKRSGTPVRKRAQSKGRKSNIGVSDASVTDPTDAPPKKRRGRPRKNPLPETVDNFQSLIDDEPQQDTEIINIDATPTPEPEPQEATTNSPEVHATVATPPGPSVQLSVPSIQTTEATPQEPSVPRPFLQGKSLMPPAEQTKSRRRPALPEYEEPVMFNTPPETELSKRLKTRKRTPHAKVVAPRQDSSDEENEIDTPPGTDEEAQVEAHPETIPLEQYLASRNEAGPVEEEEEHPDVTMYAFDEGITRMPDDTTIIDSENFSMISVDSLPSSGGFTSPAAEQLISPPSAHHIPSIEPVLDRSYLNIPSATSRSTRSSPGKAPQYSSIAFQATGATSKAKSSPAPQQRHKTPVMDTRELSNPPAIEPAKTSPTEAQTPRIGRVVKAGVALQGVLDPERLTPTESSKQTADEQLARLDDLFRGFSEGTRRELQAGLRLGEQLARQKHDRKTSEQVGSPLSSPIKQSATKPHTNDVFLSPMKQSTSRLLTPDDQDEYSLPVPPPAQINEVQYPSLLQDEQDSHLVSPARSEDEMSWRVDTPPVTIGVNGVRSFITAVNGQTPAIHGSAFHVAADVEGKEKENYEDIWQEEASRSSVDEDPLPQPQTNQTPPLDDLFSNEPLKPARGKLPRTWRRTSGSDFHYSDEAEEPPQEPTPSSSEESNQRQPQRHEKNKGKMFEPAIPEEVYNEEDDIGSEASDDTGMFFQSNLPNLFNKGRTAERRKRKTETLGHVRHFDDGQSLLPESSPARPAQAQNNMSATELTPGSAATKSSPPNFGSITEDRSGKPGQGVSHESSPVPRAKSQKPHPFRATPPRITALQSSPAKSSPLRQEIRASSSPSVQQSGFQEESTLPLPQSSPFYTNVDVTLAFSASDEHQFRQEMEGHTDSSIRLIREEADAHLNAYETQYRTLNDVTEVTEPSRSMRSTILMPSSPPKNASFYNHRRKRSERSLLVDNGQSVLPECSQVLDDSILRPRREYSPLFGEEVSASSHLKAQRSDRIASEMPIIAKAPSAEETPADGPTQAPSTGIFGRLTTAIWGTLAAPSPTAGTTFVLEREEEESLEPEPEPEPLPHHPATARFGPLPHAEPWTKTHYKTLDALYQLHKKRPATFALSRSTNSETNYTLLEHFLEDERKPFVGATYSSWGYSVDMSESLVVLSAAYMQLLSLESIEEYEMVSGKEIQMGDCNPGTPGEMITGYEVMRRLASIVMGEELRRDEKRGIPIDRSGGMTITWPAEC